MTVRPVNGFLTSSGKYFDREADAKAFDAAYFFHKRMHEFLDERGFHGILKDTAMDAIKDFVLIHKDEIMDYMAVGTDKPSIDKADQRAMTLSDNLSKPFVQVHYEEQDHDTGPVIEKVDLELTPLEEEDEDNDGFVQAFDGQ